MHKGFYNIKDTLDILFLPNREGRCKRKMAWFYINLLGGILIQAIVNIFVYAPAIIVALYLYDRFIKK